MKNQGCIYTGCVVEFVEYGQIISADVFRIETALVIRTHPCQIGAGNPNLPKDHYTADDVELVALGIGPSFWRSDLGVFVVPESSCRWIKNER